MNQPGKRGLHIAGRHGLHLGVPGVQVVQRQLVPGNVGHVGQQLAVAVDAQWKTARQIGFGGTHFGLGGAFGHVVAQHLLRHGHRLFSLLGFGLQANGEAAAIEAWRKIAAHAVREATFFAHLAHQARGKAFTQDVVAHHEGKVPRVLACVAGLAHQHLRLCGLEGQLDQLTLAQRGHGRHVGRRRALRLHAGGQLRQQGFDHLVGLGARHGAHHRGLGPARCQLLVAPALHVGHVNRSQRLCGGFGAVGVCAIHGFFIGQAGHGAGARHGFFERCGPACAVALPNRRWKIGMAQLARRQLHSGRQQLGVGERAQADRETVVAGVGAKARAQVGPGFAQLVFIHGGLRTVCGNPRRQHVGRGLRQSGLGGGHQALAGVEVNLHVHHGQTRAGDEIHLGAARLLPALDGDGGRGHANQQYAASSCQ